MQVYPYMIDEDILLVRNRVKHVKTKESHTHIIAVSVSCVTTLFCTSVIIDIANTLSVF